MAEKKKKKTTGQDIPANEEQMTAESTAAESAEVAPEEVAAEKSAASAESAEGDLQERLNELEAELTAARNATGDAEAKLLRMQADFDNFRRRQREENERTVAQAASAVIAQLLPVVDNFERALAAMGDSPDKEGVEMIAKQLMSVLLNAGLEEVEAIGADFDPNLHQAVMQADAGPENKNKITKVLQRGYMLKGKLLRAAMVEVGM